MSVGRIEQRELLRAELAPPETTVVVRGGRDTVEKLRSHAQRTARAWSLDGGPLLGVSVFAVLGFASKSCWSAGSPASARSTCRPRVS